MRTIYPQVTSKIRKHIASQLDKGDKVNHKKSSINPKEGTERKEGTKYR